MDSPIPAIPRRVPPWPLRIALGLGLLVLVRYLAIEHEPAIRGFSPGCQFRRFTGFYCAGCGGTRALFAFLKGDFSQSWSMNPLFLGGLALGLVFGTLSWSDRRWGRPRWLQRVRLTAGVGWTLLGICLVFWILRNIPGWPFSLLAPH